MLIKFLLTHLVTEMPFLRADVADEASEAAAAQDRHIRWLIEGGLGPLLHHATRAQPEAVPARWRHELLAAELTARVRRAALDSVGATLLDACAAQGVELTLLKGVSVSVQLYPEPHLRPMSDIDVLFPGEAYGKVVDALTGAQGAFERVEFERPPGPHHDEPLRHRALGVIVELHRGLYDDGSPLAAGSLFSADAVLRRAEPALWLGRRVRRLPAELQLAYIAASWFNDMTVLKVQPSFLPSLCDALLLMRHCGAQLDWRRLRGWLDNPMARGCLYALLAYLPRFGVPPAPTDFMRWLAQAQDVVGPLQLRLIHRMLDHHLVDARPWSYPFPPPMPGRYSPHYQWRKRLLDQP